MQKNQREIRMQPLRDPLRQEALPAPDATDYRARTQATLDRFRDLTHDRLASL
jgi:hypothetical protein